MAFKIGNEIVIHDADATAAIETNSNLDRLQINGTDVLIHDGSTITLKNVDIGPISEANINLDNVPEGSTNLYFTDARAIAALTPTTSALAADIIANTTAITLNTGNINTKLPLAGGTLTGALTLSGAPTSANHASTKAYVDSSISSGTLADTDGLAEGSTNLYYTDARADARATLRINAATTDNISEGSTNLYYTDARADARITNALLDEDNMASNSATKIPSQQSVKAYVDAQVASKDALSELSGNTDDVSEGSTNLYYTDARAQAVSINNVVEDTTPQLGGNLDTNGNDILVADNDKVIFGAGSDLQIYHDTNDSYIDDQGTGSIFIRSGTTYIQNSAGTKTSIATNSGAGQTIYYNNQVTLETIDGGAKVTGNLEVTGNFLTATTDNLDEGSSNQYYTVAREPPARSNRSGSEERRGRSR